MADSMLRRGRPFSRRGLAATFALALAAPTIVRLDPGNTARASGDGPVSPLVVQRDLPLWHRGWDLLTPLAAGNSFPRALLCYERAVGYLSVQTLAADGALSELHGDHTAWTNWSAIAPSRFALNDQLAGAVFYDRASGAVSVQVMNSAGEFREMRAYAGWRTSWDLLTPLRAQLLLAYDAAAGLGTLFSIDRTGGVREIRSFEGWRTTWSLMTAVSPAPWDATVDLLLMYDRSAGAGAWFTVNDAGDLAPARESSGWQTTWQTMSGAALTFFQGPGQPEPVHLSMFDPAGRAVFFGLEPGELTTLVLNETALSRGPWTTMLPVSPNQVLFYNRDSGRAVVARTDTIPPTPTPVPPTPTPLPTATPAPSPTPTPLPTIAPAQTGSTRIVLTPGGNQGNWMTYTGRPDAIPNNAVVSTVTNLGDKRVSLTHWDRENRRRGPIYVKTGQKVTDFAGVGVNGLWEATIDGSRDAAPNRITLQVDYRLT